MEGGSSFFLSADFLLEHKLKKGMVVDSTLYEQIKEESQFVEVYTKSLSLLSKQMYTEYNLKMKLLSLEYSIGSVNKALDLLKEKSYIDDYTFAYKWVESRIRNKLDSSLELIAGLIKKGISNNIANSVVSELYTQKVKEKIIKGKIEKYYKQNKSAEYIKKSLSRKGFDLASIIHYID